MTRITLDSRAGSAQTDSEVLKVLHCVNLRYKTVAKRPLFSVVCLEGRKIPFKVNDLRVCLKNGQFSEACQNQRKIPDTAKLSKDLSTGMVDIKVLEPSSVFVAGQPVGDSV
ncbi:hypothetical protein [uncultured Pseudosulfitobacter sp.]|uniref:hypothetical protein n=1 Tax=uncultured Pseudosulfitobacter sp. TaxID=2854214 RepID=UPI0030D7D043|tara:strand:- start:75 stop:410 length:336 start_codon:yes stop_codon:yes gene_type:complete